MLPGWSQADIPLVAYNEQYAFLVGYPDPPPGWVTVPQGARRGQAWEPVPGDDFYGQPYYRQRLADPEVTPQAFTVRIGDGWAASMATLDWFKISLAQQFRQDLPGPLKPVFPYSLAVNLLISGSDRYATLVLHEAAHAYQGIKAPQRIAAGEEAGFQLDDRYPWQDEVSRRNGRPN